MKVNEVRSSSFSAYKILESKVIEMEIQYRDVRIKIDSAAIWAFIYIVQVFAEYAALSSSFFT